MVLKDKPYKKGMVLSMKSVTKRDNRIVEFDREKIVSAIQRAFIEVDGALSDSSKAIAESIANKVALIPEDMSVEQIQDQVIYSLMGTDRKDVAKAYTEYRFKHNLARDFRNTTDQAIMDLLDHKNEEINGENSNKDPEIVSVQRDYIAGITSKDITKRILLDEDIVKADVAGIIHFHDADYYAQNVLTNCSLCNLEDMLQNGTVINGTKIDKPHRFITASTIATQIITAVTSSQYGGISITLTHLAPFVRDSYNRYLAKYRSWGFDEKQAAKYADIDTRKEVEDGCQTFIYQVNSMSTTNGQAPFLTVFMYINETEEYRDELIMLIEEFLRQRIQGMKNEQGVWVTPAFPKLIYVLDEDNIKPGSKYYDTTVLAAQCTAKRMVPDYISAKKMKELKGYVYPCMGCVVSDEVILYQYNNESHVSSMEEMWNALKDKFDVISQETGIAGDTYMDFTGVKVYDHVNGWTECKRMIHNHHDKILRVTFTNGRVVEVTYDHPFTVETNSSTESIVLAEKLNAGDIIKIDSDFKAFNEDDLKEYNSPNDEKPAQAAENFVLNKVRDDELLTLDTIFNYKEATRREFLYGLIQTMRDDLTFVKDPKVDPDPRDENRSSTEDYGSNYKIIAIHYLEKSRALKIMMLAQSVGVHANIHVEDEESRHYQDLYKLQIAPTYELVKTCEDSNDAFWGVFSDSVMNTLENGELFHQEYAAVESITRRYALRESYDVTTESEHFSFSGIYSHNCRSFLTPYKDPKTGEGKFYGRFNCGVVTISLPDLAFSSGGDYNKFWDLFEERTELCHRALRARIDRIKDVSVNVAPILWRHGAFARLPQDAKIGDAMFGGYATISLGYAGLYECVKYMTGHSHMDKGVGTKFGLKVMQALNDKCTQWKKAENIDYSLYGTPIENTTYKFARCLKKRFGNDIFVKLDGKDRDYITNSYHTAVFEKINPFDKLVQEAEFQKLSPGGAISYIEASDLTHNIPAILQVMQCIYENIMYAEINIKSDYCMCCGFDGEIKVIDDGGKLVWECPNCGNRDQHKMSVARRTCGLNYSI